MVITYMFFVISAKAKGKIVGKEAGYKFTRGAAWKGPKVELNVRGLDGAIATRWTKNDWSYRNMNCQ